MASVSSQHMLGSSEVAWLVVQGLWIGLMALTTLLLLLPPCHFTHVWHIASEQFNSDNDYSPVWEAYRVSLRPL